MWSQCKQYDIIGGNIDQASSVDKFTGKLKVTYRLDYETMLSYELKVMTKLKWRSHCELKMMRNESSCFCQFSKDVTILEGTLREGCLVKWMQQILTNDQMRIE